MDHEFRSRLVDELSTAPEPPMDDLVDASIRQGRRLRLWRRLQVGGVAAAVLTVAATTAAIALRSPAGGAPDLPVAAPPATTSTVAAPPPWVPPAGAVATGPEVKATQAGVLELLLSLLPAGRTSDYSGSGDGSLLVQTYLDTGAGPGMLRVSVADVAFGAPTPSESDLQRRCAEARMTACPDPDDGTETVGPTPLAGGAELTVIQIPGNCVQRTVVEVHHPDGTKVQINIGSCLAWDGSANRPGPQVLTVEQATAIAADPRWGTRLAQSLVDAGEAHFPNLTAIG